MMVKIRLTELLCCLCKQELTTKLSVTLYVAYSPCQIASCSFLHLMVSSGIICVIVLYSRVHHRIYTLVRLILSNMCGLS